MNFLFLIELIITAIIIGIVISIGRIITNHSKKRTSYHKIPHEEIIKECPLNPDWKCPLCSKVNNSSLLKCSCGYKKNPDDFRLYKECPDCGLINPDTALRCDCGCGFLECPHCGLLNPDTALRCNCGYDFIIGQTKKPFKMLIDRQNKTIGGEHVLVALGLGIILFLTILLIILIQKRFPGPHPPRLLIGLLIGWVGCYLLLFLWATWMAYDSQFWHITKGKIVYNLVKKYALCQYGPSYGRKIIYEYIVGSTIYSSKQIAFGYISDIDKYSSLKIGKTVNVYYRPDNPKVAVLRPGFSEEYKRQAFSTPIVIILLVAMIYYAIITGI